MPSKPEPRIAAIRRWVALGAVIAFLGLWLVLLTLGKGGLATTTKAAVPATSSSATQTDTTTQTDTATQSDAATQTGGGSSDQSSSPPSLDTSQS